MTLIAILIGTVAAGVGSVWLAALLGFAMLARFTQHMLSLAAGATLQNVSDALGHASVTTTQVYAKIVDRRRGNPSQFMADLLGQVA